MFCVIGLGYVMVDVGGEYVMFHVLSVRIKIKKK